MKKQLQDFFTRKRNVLTVICVGALIGTTYFIQGVSDRIQNLSLLNDGIQTCFARLNQTFTSKLIKAPSTVYLDSSFMKMTEECFGESISLLDEKFRTLLSGSYRKLNTLASDAHWFHDKIVTSDNGKTLVSVSDLDTNLKTRFSRIEGVKDEIITSIEDSRSNLMSILVNLKISFYGLIFILPLLFIFEFLFRRKREHARLELEKEAELELLGGELADNGKVGDIIHSALITNEMKQCSKLFSEYNLEMGDRISAYMPKTYNEIVCENKNEVEADEELAPLAEQTILDDVNLSDLSIINVDSVLANVVDHLSSTLFTKGVVLDLDIEEKIHVYAEDDSLEQIFFHLINNSISSCIKIGGIRPKRISIQMKKLGSTIIIDLVDSGEGFSSDFFLSTGGLRVATEKNVKGIGLSICHDLIEANKGKIFFENIIADDGRSVIGAKVKLVMHLATEVATTTSPRLTSIKKASKKELLREFAKEREEAAGHA